MTQFSVLIYRQRFVDVHIGYLSNRLSFVVIVVVLFSFIKRTVQASFWIQWRTKAKESIDAFAFAFCLRSCVTVCLRSNITSHSVRKLTQMQTDPKRKSKAKREHIYIIMYSLFLPSPFCQPPQTYCIRRRINGFLVESTVSRLFLL